MYKRFIKMLSLSICTIGLGTMLEGCHRTETVSEKQADVENSEQQKQSSIKQNKKAQIQQQRNQNKFENQLRNKLANLPYKQGSPIVIQINQNHSNLNINEWKQSNIVYGSLDRMGKINHLTTAFLDHDNYIANPTIKSEIKTIVGYHPNQNTDIAPILSPNILNHINRKGAYDSKINQVTLNNQNSMVLTKDAQKQLNQYKEQLIKTLQQTNSRVIIQFMPIYRGSDVMAKGLWMQAVGTDGLNFNIYIQNVQSNKQYDYSTGLLKKIKISETEND